MGGVQSAVWLAVLFVAGSASAFDDIARSESRGHGTVSYDVVVQVHCGGPLPTGMGAEVFVDGVRASPDETGTDARHTGRTAVGDIPADGRINDGDYGACPAMTALRTATIATGIASDQVRGAFPRVECTTSSIREEWPDMATDPTNIRMLRECGGPQSVESTWDTQRKAVDDRVPNTAPLPADPVQDATPADVKDILP